MAEDTMAEDTEEYPDLNNNGIPDVFEDRLPITQILNLPADSVVKAVPVPVVQVVEKTVEKVIEKPVQAQPGTVIIEVETRPRRPKRGETFIRFDGFEKCDGFQGSSKYLIVRRVISGQFDD